MSCPPSGRRRRLLGNGTTISPQGAEATRDWASLPRDILLDIFLRLGPREVMLGAEFACKPWRRVALEEPSLWRHIGTVSPFGERRSAEDVEMAMKLVAVGRAARQCEAFQGDCNDDYLLKLVERAPSLKDLCISEHSSDCESGEALVEALKKLHLLEEFLVYFNYTPIHLPSLSSSQDENILRSICQACPHLKKLVLYFEPIFGSQFNKYEYLEETIDAEIPVMPKLHTLELYACDLKVEGLKAILDSCPVLETLFINGFFDEREMDEELRMNCARVKNLTLRTSRRSDISATEEEYDVVSLDDYDYLEEDDILEE